jgi:hypothetical protein
MPLSAGRVFSDQTGLVRLAGTPEQIGTLWGQINKETIVRDIETSYVQKAAAAGISQETLLQRAAVTVRIIEQLAPHWLEEARAVARAADVPEDLYVAYLDGVTRDRFLRDDPEECTSYAVSRDHARGGAILFHKTRDNREVAQAAYLVESSLEGHQQAYRRVECHRNARVFHDGQRQGARRRVRLSREPQEGLVHVDAGAGPQQISRADVG